MALPERPRFRPEIEPYAVEVDGRRMIALHDPLGLARGVGVSQAAAALCELMDGTRAIVDIQAEWAKRTGELVMSPLIEGLVRQLDECLYLDSERFEKAVREMAEKFRASPVRAAAHVGGAY